MNSQEFRTKKHKTCLSQSPQRKALKQKTIRV
jgi:hypothetical protein